MNRLLTSIVQIFLAISAIYVFRLMWAELKQDLIDTVKELKK